jgi:hypothetical protein
MLVDLIMLAGVLKVGLGLLFSELNLGLTSAKNAVGTFVGRLAKNSG